MAWWDPTLNGWARASRAGMGAPEPCQATGRSYGERDGKGGSGREVRWGWEGNTVFGRVDLAGIAAQLEGLEIQGHPENDAGQLAVIRLAGGAAVVEGGGNNDSAQAAFRDVLEI